jgi:nucleotide-binding universal stress UspA family protein
MQAMRAVAAVTGRPWKAGTEMRVVSVVELILPPTLTMMEPGDEGFPPDRLEFLESQKVAHGYATLAAQMLSKVCLHVTEAIPVVSRGAKSAILEEAERWDADCIFLGSHGLEGLDRFLLGSVSEAVATHAHCCVEVVR